jgi:hypothetical protein
MKAQKSIWLLVFLIITLIVGLSVWTYMNQSVDWSFHYFHRSKQPYGTKFIHELLKEKYTKQNFVLGKQPLSQQFKKLDTTRTYDLVRIGDYLAYDSSDVAALLAFAAKGNNVFISSDRVEDKLLDSLFSYKEPQEVEKDTVPISDSTCIDIDSLMLAERLQPSLDSNLVDLIDDVFDVNDWFTLDRPYYNISKSKKLTVKEVAIQKDFTFYTFQFLDTITNSFRFLNKSYLDELEGFEYEVFSTKKANDIVYMAVPYGKGHFYIHENPILFTNVQLLSEERLTYSEQVFAQLNGEIMIWDIHQSVAETPKRLKKEDMNSPLSYFLTHPPLKWSFYLTLLGALLFILFKAKRKQKYIEVLAVKGNSSMEYAEMMGQLYFKEQNHSFIARQLWKKFLDFTKEHFGMVIKENNSSWMDKLEEKSGFPMAKLKGIELAYQKSKLDNFSEDDLMNFYNKLQYFYSNCK